jgi:hypothetical protein
MVGKDKNSRRVEGKAMTTRIPRAALPAALALALPPQGKTLRASSTRAKRRAAPKGGNSAAKLHCKRFYDPSRPSPMELVFTLGGTQSLVPLGLSTRRGFKGLHSPPGGMC